MFEADRGYVLAVNVDPRLFLHEQPTDHPPVLADWFREMSPEEIQGAEAKAGGYLRRALELRFGGTAAPFPDFEFRPIDGSTNQPLDAESAEVHLLATARGSVPAGKVDFELFLSREANTSLILLKSFGGEAERRPSVLFPGETSLPFALNYPVTAAASENNTLSAASGPAGGGEPVMKRASGGTGLWSAVALGTVVCVLASLWRLKRPRGR